MFAVLAFLSPLAVGLLLPFLLSLEGRRWRRIGVGMGAVGAVLLIALLFSTHGLGNWLALVLYLSGLGLFMAGVFETLRMVGIPPAPAQVLCGLLMAAMVASMFCADPFIQASEAPQDLVPVFSWIEPMVAVSDAIDGGDVARLHHMYGIMRLADYGMVQVSWLSATLWLGLLGGALLALSRWRSLIRKKHGPEPVQPPDSLQGDWGRGAEEAPS